ncbi:glycerate kinase [Galleria mellonella]|uniref:Glycerate kinase n=1 Tax=Galleria mellonella TaxID=7137 RepID=A0A6J1WJQ1_GALME|nr:glycerate kinase [Galleria mellonella]
MSKSVICDLLQIFKSSVSAVLPENLIRNSIKYCPINKQLFVFEEIYNIAERNVYVVGFGKAVQNMAIEIENILGSKIKHGIVSIPAGSCSHKSVNKNMSYYEGARNNLPDTNAEKTASKVNDIVTKLNKNDLLLVLISGGGSALLPLPKGSITLEEKTKLIQDLGNSGADISELNTVRKSISDLKGGQLAIKAQPAEVVSLILSDIVGDPLDLIASGPTTENHDSPLKTLDILKKYNLLNNLPESVNTVLKNGYVSQPFPKANVQNYIIGSNKLSIAAALNEAKNLNYLPVELSNVVIGNVTALANQYSQLTKIFCEYLNGNFNINALRTKIEKLKIPGIKSNFIDNINQISLKYKDVCLILGGETTVEVKGTGKGGRNQQLALEFSNIIHNMKGHFKGFDIYILSAGTDGIDGPTDAAGAIGHLDLVTNLKNLDIDINQSLNNNDSYNFFKKYKNGDFHIKTGHTNTNVMDIHLIVIKRIK